MAIDETLLKQMSTDIESRLKAKRLSVAERRALQMDRLMIAFMEQNLETQARVNVMWAVYKPMAWVMSIAAATIIGLLASGRVDIILK